MGGPGDVEVDDRTTADNHRAINNLHDITTVRLEKLASSTLVPHKVQLAYRAFDDSGWVENRSNSRYNVALRGFTTEPGHGGSWPHFDVMEYPEDYQVRMPGETGSDFVGEYDDSTTLTDDRAASTTGAKGTDSLANVSGTVPPPQA